MFLFMIVGKKDAPLFEAELQAGVKAEVATSSTQKKEETHMPNFIIHASLDVVEEAAWKNPNMYALHLRLFSDARPTTKAFKLNPALTIAVVNFAF